MKQPSSRRIIKEKGKKFSQFFLHEKTEIAEGIGFEELDYEVEEKEIIEEDEKDGI